MTKNIGGSVKINLFPKRRSLPNSNGTLLISVILTFTINFFLFAFLGKTMFNDEDLARPMLWAMIATSSLIFWTLYRRRKPRRKRR